MSTHVDGTGSGHPITDFLDLLEAGLDDVAAVPAWSLDAEDTAGVITRLDPDHADEHEAKLLARQEARARKRTEFRMWNDGEGLAHGRFTLPEAQAAMLRKALVTLASPKHVRATEGAGSYDHERPTPQKMGWAFGEYIERYPTDRLAKMGGMTATVVVTVEAEVFTQGAQKAGTTDAGVKVSPGQLLRWACEANLIPAVVGKEGQVLDLGRTHRFHTPAQRLAADGRYPGTKGRLSARRVRSSSPQLRVRQDVTPGVLRRVAEEVASLADGVERLVATHLSTLLDLVVEVVADLLGRRGK